MCDDHDHMYDDHDDMCDDHDDMYDDHDDLCDDHDELLAVYPFSRRASRPGSDFDFSRLKAPPRHLPQILLELAKISQIFQKYQIF